MYTRSLYRGTKVLPADRAFYRDTNDSPFNKKKRFPVSKKVKRDNSSLVNTYFGKTDLEVLTVFFRSYDSRESTHLKYEKVLKVLTERKVQQYDVIYLTRLVKQHIFPKDLELVSFLEDCFPGVQFVTEQEILFPTK